MAGLTNAESAATLDARFWSKVDRSSGDCWLWTAGVSRAGYGTFGLGSRASGKTVAHRVAYQLTNGPIPEGMQVDHICGVRRCVRPEHLRAVSPRENSEHRVAMDSRNRSGYRGVAWHSQAKKWSAQVQHLGRKIHLGLFADPQEAAAAAAAKRAELFAYPGISTQERQSSCQG